MNDIDKPDLLKKSFFTRRGSTIVKRCPACGKEDGFNGEISGNPIRSGMKCMMCGYEDGGNG